MIHTIHHHSASLAHAPLSGPKQRDVAVYLPPNYDAERAQPYPSIYLLAGFGSRSSKYLADYNPYSRPLNQRLDDLILNQQMPPVIIVFPDGTSALGCHQYINSPATGNGSDYIADELPALLEKQFHIAKQREQRGAIGHSSGGFGVLWLGMQRDDRFSAITSLAGDSFFTVSLLPMLVPACIELQRAGGIRAFLDTFFKMENPNQASSNQYLTMMVLCLAGCYAPNLTIPDIYGELFFDWQTGELLPNSWQKYLAHDPLYAVHHHHQNLKNLTMLTLAAGQQDEFGLQLGHRQLHQLYQQANIPHEHHEFTDKHSGYDWRLAHYIAAMAKRLDPKH